MTLVLSDTTTNQGLIEAIKFDTGQDSISNQDVIRCINLALDDYSSLELIANRRWKSDGTTNTDLPIASATMNALETHIPLESDMLTVEEVEWNGSILKPIDRSEYKDQTPEQVFGTGTPQYYDYVAEQLFLYPTPIASGTVKVHFGRAYPYFATTDTTATIPVPTIHHNYIIANASERVAFAKNDPDYTKFLNRKLTEEVKVKSHFGLREQDTPKQLVSLTQDNK